GRAARHRRRGAVEVGLRQQVPARLVDALGHLRIAVEPGGERLLHQQLAVDDLFERLGGRVARRDLDAVHLGDHDLGSGLESRGALAADQGREQCEGRELAGSAHQNAYPSLRRATHTAAARPARSSIQSRGSRASATANWGEGGVDAATRTVLSAALAGARPAAPGPASPPRWPSSEEDCAGWPDT